MVPFLARIFRQFHLIVGVTAPPPGVEEKKFVLIWLAVIGVVIAWSALVLYLMVYVF
jgi:hypothetical protein